MPNTPSHYGGYGGTFQECVAKVSGWSDNPEGFCNWIHQQANGVPPGKDDAALPDNYSMAARCDGCGNMVGVRTDDTWGPHDANGSPCSSAGKKWQDRVDADEQSRVPAGSAEGGQFAGNGGAKSGSPSTKAGVNAWRAHEVSSAKSRGETRSEAPAQEKGGRHLRPDPGTHPAPAYPGGSAETAGGMREHGHYHEKMAEHMRSRGEWEMAGEHRFHATKFREKAERAEKKEARVRSANNPYKDGLKHVKRFDVGTLKSPEKTKEGFLRVDGRISRVGIQIYRTGGGATRREFRPADEVFSEDSLASFRQVPVTNDHPTQLLDSKSAKEYVVGSIGESVRRDDDFVAAPLMLYNEDVIAAVECGRSQLSCGYSCDIDETPGEWNGQQYDAIQRNIRGNHVALVDVARAGPGACLRLDADDAAVLGCERIASKPAPEEKTRMANLRIDGINLEITEGNAAAIQQHVDRLAQEKTEAQKRVDAAGVKLERVAGATKLVRAAVSKVRSVMDAAKAKMMKCDECGGGGMVGKNDATGSLGKKCDYCDGAGKFRMHDKYAPPSDDGDEEEMEDAVEAMKDAATELEGEQATEEESKKAGGKDRADRLDALRADSEKRRVDGVARRAAARKLREDSLNRRMLRGKNERVALEIEAARHVGADNAKFDSMTDREVRVAVLAKLAPTVKMDGRSDEVVQVVYDLEVGRVAKGPDAAARARAGMAAGDVTARHDGAPNPDAARQNMVKNLQDAWKTPAKDAAAK